MDPRKHLRMFDSNVGLQMEPQNEASKQAVKEAMESRARARSRPSGSGGMGNLFGPDFMLKIATDPRTRHLTGDAEFQSLIREMSTDPMGSMQRHMKNPKFQLAMQVWSFKDKYITILISEQPLAAKIFHHFIQC